MEFFFTLLTHRPYEVREGKKNAVRAGAIDVKSSYIPDKEFQLSSEQSHASRTIYALNNDALWLIITEYLA